MRTSRKDRGKKGGAVSTAMTEWGLSRKDALAMVEGQEREARRRKELANPTYDLRIAVKIRTAWESVVRIWIEDEGEWTAKEWAEWVVTEGLAEGTAKQLVTMMIRLGVLEGPKGGVMVHVRRWDEVGVDGK